MPEQQVGAQPALQELLTLAARTRGDIDVRELEGLLAEVLEAGKPWSWVMVQTVRMLARAEEGVRDLRYTLTDPLGFKPRRR